MRTARDFLEQECANLQGVLEETLRFKYGLEGSKEFFDECQARLIYLTDELSKAKDSDLDELQKISILLNRLTDLIARIEQSSIGEYSWPFVEELKRIAVAICTEPTLTNPKTRPQIYVLSSGGLDTYGIRPELNRPSGSSKRIHTIIFPRTLKHFVLLHSILGHEVGHAMWKCSQHQHALRRIVARDLFASGVFADPAATAAWLYSNNAPAGVKQILANLATMRGTSEKNFFSIEASWHAWIEEILCDFIGLVTFGPSFIAAECNLLYACNPAGTVPGPKHPPVGCRANYLLSAATLLGHTSDSFGSESLKGYVRAFWNNLAAKRQADPWFDVFTVQQIQSTAGAIEDLLRTLPPSLYVAPQEADLALLVDQLMRVIPPVGFHLDVNQSVSSRPIDFRHVLYAGWITSATPPSDIFFAQLNRLCEHGIMQQRAIEIQAGRS